MEQAKHDALKSLSDLDYIELPAVFHRKNKKDWKVTMDLSEWIKLYQAYETAQKVSK
jgi:hypothetical protein